MKSVRSTPSLAFAILAALALLLVALAIAPRAQTQMAAPAPVAYEQVVEQLKKQQETMVANQAKMDEQISNIKEEIPLDPHLQQKGRRAAGAARHPRFVFTLMKSFLMNSRFLRTSALLALVAVFIALPSSQVRSQTSVPPDVFEALAQLAARNQEILQHQEETIRSLDDALNEARQAKIFSKRG